MNINNLLREIDIATRKHIINMGYYRLPVITITHKYVTIEQRLDSENYYYPTYKIAFNMTANRSIEDGQFKECEYENENEPLEFPRNLKYEKAIHEIIKKYFEVI